MAFQFLCPQGHLLEGDESQAGQPCHCPQCGTQFLIPHPMPSPVVFPGIRTTPDPKRQTAPNPSRQSVEPPDARPELVHIPCPSGHELETPREWLGKLAMCPFCKAQFHLRWEKSVEYRRKKAEDLERRQARAARLWLQWSIAAAVFVVLGLIVMIVLSR